uniref:Adenylosuccinate synthetase n=1 Tax=Parastrongyloides trichosuri TaxID=131310 RepID=A0A0N4Z193_PARTI
MTNITPAKRSPVHVLLGAQWGDEGKGKIIDYLINCGPKYDITARCQGGNNAGHTVVVNGKKYDFHLLPSGVCNETCMNVIGNGIVFNIPAFFDEIKHNGIDQIKGWEKRILVSSRAHLVLGIHSQVDGRQEEKLADTAKIGTTNRGIGPTYSSKCFRNGLRVVDILGDFNEFSKKYRTLVEHYCKQFPNIVIDVEEELKSLKIYAENLRTLGVVADTAGYLDKARLEGKTILVEGANGALLDIDFGTYPFVTSSNSTVGGACTGLGLPPTAITEVIGVVKAYQTRVGTGPFPTEQLNEIGDKLQSIGKEFGVTTGRRRRCGWLDLFLLKRTAIINGLTQIALTKVDILDTFEEIKICVGYKLDGINISEPPAHAGDWDRVETEYITVPGWNCDTSNARSYDDLPEACRKYIEYIENFVQVPIKYIGVGVEREALIVRY